MRKSEGLEKTMALSSHLPTEAVERVKDFLYGDQECWRGRFKEVVAQMKAYQPEEIQKKYFRTVYYRVKDITVDVYEMMDDLFYDTVPEVLVESFLPAFQAHIAQKHPWGRMIIDYMGEFHRMF